MTDVRDCEACGGDGVECDNKTHDCYPCPRCEGTGKPVTYPRQVGIDITYPDWTVHLECTEEAPRDYQRCKSQGTTVNKPVHQLRDGEVAAVHGMMSIHPVAVEAVPRKNQRKDGTWGNGANHV